MGRTRRIHAWRARSFVDLVVADGSSNQVSILRNEGDGTFESPAAMNVGNGPHSTAVGDLDGDLDVVTANGTGDPTALVLWNQ